MARDPLAALLRLRQAASDEAQRVVVACVTAEAAAAKAADGAERAIDREMQAATELSGDDAVVEAFAAWLPTARKAAIEARQRHEARQADTGRARAVLVGCRTALETVQTLRDQRTKADQEVARRREIAALDEAARLSGRLAMRSQD